MTKKVKLPDYIIRSFEGYGSLSDYLAGEFCVEPDQEFNEIQIYIENHFSNIVDAWLNGYVLDDPEQEKDYQATLNKLVRMSDRLGYSVRITGGLILVDRGRTEW